MDALGPGVGQMKYLPMFYRGGISGLLVLLLLTVATVSLDARVYIRRGRATGQQIDAGELGWQYAGSGEMTVNGKPSTVQVFAAQLSSQRAVDRLRILYERRGAQSAAWAEGEMGWGLAVWPEKMTRFFVLAPRMYIKALIFVVHTDTSESRRQQAGLPGIPDYPGARPGSLVQNPDAGISLRFLFTRDSTADILAFYDRALGSAGWQPLITGPSGERAHGPLAVYARGRRVCYVSVSAGREPGADHVITVLVQERGG